VRAPLRVRDGEPGTVFMPFNYAGTGQANVLTMTVWDPVSKQPVFKTAACRVEQAH
jgi:ferredoxin-nitrate reductase